MISKGLENLRGKSILFIGRNFFGYNDIIKNRLLEIGASIDYIDDVPYQSNYIKAALRVVRPVILPDASRRILSQIRLFGKRHYDFVFVIIGEGLDSIALSELRTSYPRATFILHIWDAIENNRRALVKNFHFFDKVSSFDKSDSNHYDLNFRPLFYSAIFEKEFSDDKFFKYDVCFIGTAHSDRSVILKKLQENLENQGTACFVFQYLQAPWLYYVYNLFDRRYKDIPISSFSFVPISQSKVADIIQSSRVVVDIPHSKQKGLTIRTFECLGASKKMATTNASILDYDFYCPENIHLLSRTTPLIPKSFIESEYKTIPDETKSKYTLDHWLFDIFH